MFNALKAETIIRDIYKDRYKQSLNQRREDLLERESNLPRDARADALNEARRIETIISRGETKPFYRAYDAAASTLADHLGITERGAKELMKSIYKEVEGKELYEAGKAWEKTYHQPAKEAQRETAKQERAQHRTQDKPRKQSKSRMRARA